MTGALASEDWRKKCCRVSQLCMCQSQTGPLFPTDQAGCSLFLFLFCPKYLKKNYLLFLISLARFSSRCVLPCLIPTMHPDFFSSVFHLFSICFNLQLCHQFFCYCCYFPRKHLLSIIQSQFLFCFIAIRCLRKDRQQLCFFFPNLFPILHIPWDTNQQRTTDFISTVYSR